jgi:hypothetical protein
MSAGNTNLLTVNSLKDILTDFRNLFSNIRGITEYFNVKADGMHNYRRALKRLRKNHAVRRHPKNVYELNPDTCEGRYCCF